MKIVISLFTGSYTKLGDSRTRNSPSIRSHLCTSLCASCPLITAIMQNVLILLALFLNLLVSRLTFPAPQPLLFLLIFFVLSESLSSAYFNPILFHPFVLRSSLSTSSLIYFQTFFTNSYPLPVIPRVRFLKLTSKQRNLRPGLDS